MLLIGRIHAIGSSRWSCLAFSKMFYSYKVKEGTRKLFEKAQNKQTTKRTKQINEKTQPLSQEKFRKSRHKLKQMQSIHEGKTETGSGFEDRSSLYPAKKEDIYHSQKMANQNKIEESGLDQNFQQIIEQLILAGHQEQASTLQKYVNNSNLTIYHQYLLQLCNKFHAKQLPSIIEAIVSQHFNPNKIRQWNYKTANPAFQQCISGNQQQLIAAIQKQNFEFAQLLHLWLAFSQYRSQYYWNQESFTTFGGLFMQIIIDKAAITDLSAEENLNALNQYYNSQGVRNVYTTGAQIDFFLVFCQQMPFFGLPQLQRSLQIITNSRKLYALLKSRSLKIILNLVTMQVDDLIEVMPQESIFLLILPLMRLSQRYRQHFQARDKMIGLVFRALLQKKISKGEFSLSLKTLARFINMVGGRMILEEPEKIRSEFFAYIFKDIRKYENIRQQYIHNNITSLQEVLSLLFQYQVFREQECRHELDLLKKKISGLPNINEKTFAEFERFLQTEPKNKNLHLTDQFLKKLGSYQIYERLEDALTQQKYDDMQMIISILLNGKSGHYFYSFCKIRVNSHKAETIFNKAINKLVEMNRLSLFKDIFYRNLKKPDRRNPPVNEMFYRLTENNNLDAKELWGYYLLGWYRAYREQKQQERYKLVGSFFDTLVRLKNKIIFQDFMLYNPLFYSILQSIINDIQKNKDQNRQAQDYFYDLLDYLLNKEINDKSISIFLESIIFHPKLIRIISKNKDKTGLFDIPTKVIRFRLRYKSPSQPRNWIIYSSLNEDYSIQLTENQKRLMKLCEGEHFNTALPILKQNLLLLLAQPQLYSKAQKEEIDQLLVNCNQYQLSQILCSPISQMIPKIILQLTWKLLLEKMKSVQGIMWKYLILNYSNNCFENQIRELTRKVLQYYCSKPDELSLSNFQVLTQKVLKTGLIQEKEMVRCLLQRYCPELFERFLQYSKERIIESLKVYILAGYPLKLQYFSELIQQISRYIECYYILFSYEESMSQDKFQRLLHILLSYRQNYLQEQNQLQDNLVVNLLNEKYPDLSQSFLAFNDENMLKNRKYANKSLIWDIYKRLAERYEGVKRKNNNYIEVQNTIIVLLQIIEPNLKKAFILKALTLNPENKNKTVRFINLKHPLSRETATQYVASELNLKRKHNIQSLAQKQPTEGQSKQSITPQEDSAKINQKTPNSGNSQPQQ